MAVVAAAERISPYFEPSGQIALTAELLAEVGLPAAPFANLTIDVVQSGKGKFHLPGDTRLERCQHVSRAYGYRETPPTRTVSVFGEFDGCAKCFWISLPGPAGVLWDAAQLAVRAWRWVGEFERLAVRMTWLEVSRWTSQTPFDPNPMPALLAGLAGARGYARHRATVAGVWEGLRQRAESAAEMGRQAAGPPGLRVLAARARDLISRDAETLAEAQSLASIAGGWHSRTYGNPFVDALTCWVTAISTDGDTTAARQALHQAIDSSFAGRAVRDVSLLPRPAVTAATGFCSPGAWADAEFEVVRRSVVNRWCDRLEAAARPADVQDDQLVLLLPYPIISEPDADVAYLAQYPELGRVCAQADDGFGNTDRLPWAAVLRVPGFAAVHVLAQRRGSLTALPGPTLDPGVAASTEQVRALLRKAARYLPADADDDPDGPLQDVAEWREGATGPYSRYGYPLQEWVAAGASARDLPARWKWTPATDTPAELAVLATFLEHRYDTYPVVMALAAGPAGALEEVTVTATLTHADPVAGTITYLPQTQPACPAVTVTLRRIVTIRASR